MFIARLLGVLIFLLAPFETILVDQIEGEGEKVNPIFKSGEIIYADIDTTRQRIFLLLEDGLWQHSLEQGEWTFLASLEIPEKLKDLEFGYNSVKNKLQLWSRGIGKVYDINLEDYEVQRIDRSHNHRNQYGHHPFYHKGTLHSFGGYGYWEWNSLITFYNKSVNEWNIQNIPSDSPVPERRAPATGIYKSNELYIFGGESTLLQWQDDQYSSKIYKRDIWRFSFPSLKWEKVLTLPESNFRFYTPSSRGKVGWRNTISSSFYIPEKDIWFIPMVSKENPSNNYYLKSIDLGRATVYPEFELAFGRSHQFLPTQFFYNPKDSSAVFVGFDYISNTEQSPVKVIRLSADSLIQHVPRKSTLTSQFSTHMVVGFASILIIASFIYFHFKKSSANNLPNHIDSGVIANSDNLTDKEKELLQFLFSEKKYVESQEIEELLWKEIDNYDYQRRLRNDIIKSINSKMQQYYDQEELISRKKDPNDNRRFLYGLNEELVNL